MNKQIIILSWIAIALSIIACIITFLDLDKAQITDDSFIGVMSGFIGACATILVGAQIFNSIETRNSINKLNESFANKITEINSNHRKHIRELKVLNNQLKYDISELNKKIEQAKEERTSNENKIQSYIYRVKGMTLEKQQPFTAILAFYRGLKCSLESNDITTINNALQDLETCVKRIESRKEVDDLTHSKRLGFIKPSNLSKYNLYPLIEEKYKSLYNDIIKIKDNIIQKKKGQKNE